MKLDKHKILRFMIYSKNIMEDVLRAIGAICFIGYLVLIALIIVFMQYYPVKSLLLATLGVIPFIFVVLYMNLKNSLPKIFYISSRLRNSIKDNKRNKKKYKKLNGEYEQLEYNKYLERIRIYIESISFTLPLYLSILSVILSIYFSNVTKYKYIINYFSIIIVIILLLILFFSFIIEDSIIRKIKDNRSYKKQILQSLNKQEHSNQYINLEKRYANLAIKNKQCLNKIKYMKKINEHEKIKQRILQNKIHKYNSQGCLYRIFHII